MLMSFHMLMMFIKVQFRINKIISGTILQI